MPTGADEQDVVLVVDDEKDIVETYELYLKDDYEVRTAESGGEAILELSPEVDLMLLDRRMPGLSGDEVIQRIEEIPVDTYVIMVTAVDPDFDIIDMPLDDYLTKPVDREELIEAVENVLLKDRYDELTSEYRSVNRKYSVLQSNLESEQLQDHDEFQRISKRRSEIRDELRSVLERIPDKDFSDMLTDDFEQ